MLRRISRISYYEPRSAQEFFTGKGSKPKQLPKKAVLNAISITVLPAGTKVIHNDSDDVVAVLGGTSEGACGGAYVDPSNYKLVGINFASASEQGQFSDPSHVSYSLGYVLY